jgi:hypothetical protein
MGEIAQLTDDDVRAKSLAAYSDPSVVIVVGSRSQAGNDRLVIRRAEASGNLSPTF